MRLRREARALLAATAVGYGQILFCESAAAGALLLASAAVLSPEGAVMSAAACLLSTLIARLRRYPRPEWDRGLYGYTSALVGLFWATLVAPGLEAWLGLFAAAMLAPAATRLAHRVLTPLDLPVLALPALVLTWSALPLLGMSLRAGDVTAERLVLAALLAVAALAVYSRLALLAAALGVVVSAAVCTLGGQDAEGVVVNAVPVAVALGAVFVPFSGGALLLAAAGALASVGLWVVAASWLGGLGVPPLVAPFNAVTVATLVLLRVPACRRLLPGRPAAVPIAAVGRPERAAAHWRARARLIALIAAADRVCVLSGAGVSTAAGLPDFRGPFGLGARARRITLDDFVASPEAREEYWRQEERFLRLVAGALPASVHRALWRLHRNGRLSAVVTQNVDGLHQAAGLPDDRVVEVHGALREAHCLDCRLAVPRTSLSSRIVAGDFNLYCPVCQGLLKGGSVMFGEPVAAERLDRALQTLLASDLLVVLGTSLSVFPAADMVRWARQAGIPIAIVNATPTPFDADATVAVIGDVGPILEDTVPPTR